MTFYRLFPNLFKKIANFPRLTKVYGQWRCIRNRTSVDAQLQPIPWYTYPAIEYLNSFDFSASSVFGYGAGNSSLYWSSRAKRVVSVESDPSWYEKIRGNERANLTIHCCSEPDDYVNKIASYAEKIDVIIIDGVWRPECALLAQRHIHPGGMIILDNSDRAESAAIAELLRKVGYFQIDFSGFGPINGFCWTTSVFVQINTTIQAHYRPPQPMGGMMEAP